MCVGINFIDIAFQRQKSFMEDEVLDILPPWTHQYRTSTSEMNKRSVAIIGEWRKWMTNSLTVHIYQILSPPKHISNLHEFGLCSNNSLSVLLYLSVYTIPLFSTFSAATKQEALVEEIKYTLVFLSPSCQSDKQTQSVNTDIYQVSGSPKISK